MSRKTISAGGVVLNREGRVLVVNQRGNSWSFPKGHVDAGEGLPEAARREIYEESGVEQLDLIEYLGHYDRPRIGKHGGEDHGEIKTMHFFLFTTLQDELSPKDKDNPEARWVDPDKVEELLTHPLDRAFYNRIIQKIRKGTGS